MGEVYCRLGMAEETVSKMELYDIPYDIMESDENYQIVISGWWVHIPELGLNLHEGIFCNYDKEKRAYLPDFSITVLKEETGKKTKEGEWLYYEQDGFVITLFNYLHGKTDINQIEQLFCFICIPDTEPET
ncbi:MAG: hypothetical protein K2M60_01175 [Lachnospiraceae bacterium]|nr:hypothetical protein [Lachnospiraceae bacterium]MDE6253994.1 hypothetical protein [Lachnospiraceae bacterium]